MPRALNVLLACLGLLKALSGGLLTPAAAALVQALVGAGTLASGRGVFLVSLVELLIIALPLAAWWRLTPRRPRWLTAPVSTATQRTGHALLGVATALWLLSLGMTLFAFAEPTPFRLALARVQAAVSPLAWVAGLVVLGWQARRPVAADAVAAAAAPGNTAAAEAGTPRWLIALRAAVALIGLPATALFVLLGMGMLLAGGRHADVGGAMVALLVVGALLLAAPLAVFVPRRWPGSAVWHGLGTLAAGVGIALALPNLWNELGRPWLKGRAFERQMAKLSLGPPAVEPLWLGDVPAGLRIQVVLRLAEPIRLTSDGHDTPAVAELLHGVTLSAVSPTLAWPFEAPTNRRISLKGQALAAEQLRAGAMLEAGEYRLQFDTWLLGLRQHHGEPAPCVDDRPRDASRDAALAQLRELAVRVRTSGRSESLRALGRRVHTLESEPFVHAYDHADWLRRLDALPVERCAEREARKAREREAEAARKRLDDYLAGRAPWNDNPLYAAVCAHDVAEVRRVLALGTPRMALSGMLQHCAIDATKPEIFDLVFPLAYAHAGDREGYCRLLLGRFLMRKDEASLGRLQRLGLPVACADYQLFQWLLGQSSEHPIPADQGLPWLRRLKDLGMDPCMASPAGLTLLQRAAHVAPPPYIEFLLDAGCDPAALPALGIPGSGHPFMSAQLAWLMRVRGFWRNVSERRPERLPPDVVERLSRRIGDVSQHELTRVHPKTGVAGPLLIVVQSEPGRVANIDAPLIAWMGARGLRMDAADTMGRSWYARGYLDTGGRLYQGHEMLDSLSVEQLRQLLQPVNLATGKPGKPLEAAKDKSKDGLGAYLCRRGAMRC